MYTVSIQNYDTHIHIKYTCQMRCSNKEVVSRIIYDDRNIICC